MEPKFRIGDNVQHVSDCITVFKVVNVTTTNVNYFYDIKSEKIFLEDVPEQELSLVEEN